MSGANGTIHNHHLCQIDIATFMSALHLAVDRDLDVPIHRQVREGLRRAIHTCTRLPMRVNTFKCAA